MARRLERTSCLREELPPVQRDQLGSIFIEHNGRDRGDVTAIVTKGALLFN